jgi:hypothetical protein
MEVKMEDMIVKDEMVMVNNEKGLMEVVENGGWGSIEEFESDLGVKKEDVFGKWFVVCGGEFWFCKE